MPQIVIRRATAADAPTLSRIGWETFVETFVDGFAIPYPQADLDAFHAKAYAPEVFARDLADPVGATWLAEEDGGAAGFAQVGAGPSFPHAEVQATDGELKRLYVRRAHVGGGLGERLMRAAMDWLAREGPRPVWLSVWSENHRAQRFYRRWGFEKAGEYGFRVGETVDHEFIFRRP